MPFRIEVSGMDELIENVKKLENEAKGLASVALYEGARVVADAVSHEVQGISTEPFKYAKDGEKRKPSPEEKEVLVSAPHGVSKFRPKLKAVDTTVGYNGADYANVNFSHMSSSARTNYKDAALKNHWSNQTSFLKYWDKTKGTRLRRGAQDQKPVGAIANAINSGTSFMQKQPFMRKAFSKSKKQAISAIEGKLQELVNEWEL